MLWCFILHQHSHWKIWRVLNDFSWWKNDEEFVLRLRWRIPAKETIWLGGGCTNPFEKSDRQIGWLPPKNQLWTCSKKSCETTRIEDLVPGWFWIPFRICLLQHQLPCLNFAPGRLAGKSWLMMEKSWLHFGCWNEGFYNTFYCINK